MASEYTPNRRYPLYTDSDKPNLRDQYNGAIREIDADMAQALADSSGVASSLGAGFDAQHTVRMAIDANTQAVSDESTARTSADTALGQRITDETSARTSADTALGQRITDETSARTSADSALGQRITDETSARTSADTTLGQRITDEVTARTAADTALESKINQLRSFVGRKVIFVGDSFSDVSNEWGGWVAGLAGYLGCNIYNYAHNGSGFVNKSVTDVPFLEQLQTGLSEHPDATDVIIYGGNNDANSIENSISTFNSAVVTFFTWVLNNASTLNYHLFIGNFPNNRVDMGWTARYYITAAALAKGIPIHMYPYVNAVQVINAGYYSDSNVHPSSNFANSVLKQFFAESLLNGASVPTNIAGITPKSGITLNGNPRVYCAGDAINIPSGLFTVTKEAGSTANTYILADITFPHPISTNVCPNCYQTGLITAGNVSIPVTIEYNLNDRVVKLYTQADVRTVVDPLTSFPIFVDSKTMHVAW